MHADFEAGASRVRFPVCVDDARGRPLDEKTGATEAPDRRAVIEVAEKKSGA